MDLPLRLSLDLVALGLGVSGLAVFLEGLILKIDDHPRLKRVWKYTPVLFGIVVSTFFPHLVLKDDSILILWLHGGLSPLVGYASFPLLEKAIGKPLSLEALSKPTPTKEDTPKKPAKEG